MTMVKGDNYTKILAQLENRNQEVNAKLLLPPNPRARPDIGLIASYGWRFQTVATGYSWGNLFGRLGVVLFALVGQVILILIALRDLLRELNPKEIEGVEQIIRQIAPNLIKLEFSPLTLAAVPSVFVLLVILIGFLRGKLSMFPDYLDLDLNGVYHISPKGRCYTAWSEFTSVILDRPSVLWLSSVLRLFKADGDYINIWIPYSERNNLAKLIELSIARHQPSSLLGRWSDYDL